MIRRLLFASSHRTPTVLAALLLALAPVAGANTGTVPGASGPDDDLGTLPSQKGPSGPGAVTEDDLGTLPATRKADPGPSLTFTGPAGAVSSLLTSVTGGDVSTEPGPTPGQVTVHLSGALRVVLRHDDPRLATVRVAFDAGELPGLGRLRSGHWSSDAFGLAPGQELTIPVRALVQRPDAASRMQGGLHLDALGAEGELYSLGLRAEGALLILDQRGS